MVPAASDRRKPIDRRAVTDRRNGEERRGGERRKALVLAPAERRAGQERRASGERRAAPERRTAAERRARESAAEHIRNAIQLLANVAEAGTLDEESLRDLDAAMFRLRFALDRLEGGTGE